MSGIKQVDVSRFFSERSNVWQPSAIRGLFPLEQIPGMISFLAGKPNPSTFPFESITLKIKSDGHADASGKANGAPIPSQPEELTISGDRLNEALQYGATAGLPSLVKWLESFQEHVHERNKANEGWRISLGIGSQDLLSKAFQLLVDDGDAVLMESPAYSYAEGFARLIMDTEHHSKANASGTLGAISPNHAKLIEVNSDEQGLSPDHLRSILEGWEKERPGQKRPKILYTIPMGSNPTGASIPESRKIEVLKLAKEYDLLVIEDDAYAFLYFGPEEKKARTYFRLEPEINQEVGRVIRFDTFSKILSSGMRLGFATAPKAFLDRMDLITANTNLQCPSTTQMMVLSLLEHWGPQGLLDHCKRVAGFYREKRDMFESAARRHLDGLADWVTPVAGMFLYIKLHLTTDGSEGDSFAVIREKAVEKGVLAVPGTSFMPSGSKSAYVRVSYSLATPEQADEGFKRLREVIDSVRSGN